MASRKKPQSKVKDAGKRIIASNRASSTHAAPLSVFSPMLPDIKFESAPAIPMAGAGLRVRARYRLGTIAPSTLAGGTAYQVGRDLNGVRVPFWSIDPNGSDVTPFWLHTIARNFTRFYISEHQLHYRTRAFAAPTSTTTGASMWSAVLAIDPDGSGVTTPYTGSAYDAFSALPNAMIINSWCNADGPKQVLRKPTQLADLYYSTDATSAVTANARQSHPGVIVAAMDVPNIGNGTDPEITFGNVWVTCAWDLYGPGLDNGVAIAQFKRQDVAHQEKSQKEGSIGPKEEKETPRVVSSSKPCDLKEDYIPVTPVVATAASAAVSILPLRRGK